MTLAHGVLSGPLTTVEIVVIAIGGIFLLVGAILLFRGRQQPKAKSGKVGIGLAALGLVTATFGPSLILSSSAACSRPTTKADIEIVAPKPGQTVQGGQVPVEMRLNGAELAGLSSTRNAPDKGHLHLSLDGKLVSMTGEVSQSIEASPGQHQLTAEFVASDHAPFCKRVTDRVRFTVG